MDLSLLFTIYIFFLTTGITSIARHPAFHRWTFVSPAAAESFAAAPPILLSSCSIMVGFILCKTIHKFTETGCSILPRCRLPFRQLWTELNIVSIFSETKVQNASLLRSEPSSLNVYVPKNGCNSVQLCHSLLQILIGCTRAGYTKTPGGRTAPRWCHVRGA